MLIMRIDPIMGKFAESLEFAGRRTDRILIEKPSPLADEGFQAV